MSADLHALAAAAGVQRHWEDVSGRPQAVSDDSLRAVLSALDLACETEAQCRDSLGALSEETAAPLILTLGERPRSPWADGPALLVCEDGRERRIEIEGGRLPVIETLGWHRLVRGSTTLELVVCPPQAVTSLDRLGRKAWGLAAQIYALRDASPRPFGDFGALATFVEAAAREGAAAVAISPVHALFAADPTRYSPYSPSSRDFLNPLYADLGASDDSGDLIDWPRAAVAKQAELRARFAAFEGDAAFDRFVAEGGDDLHRFAVFEALDARLTREGRPSGFSQWPQGLRDPLGPDVQAFARSEAAEVRFHLFAQWRADEGLAGAQAAAKASGMGIGLITDMAVGVDPYGAQAWSRPEELLTGLSLGAPPDAFQPAGQSWGITSFSPVALRRTGCRPYLRTLRAALRHAGGVRIDHALGLNRLWVVPDGAPSSAGAYLSNPLDDLLKLTALESVRAGAVIIGEDLGVVPPELRRRLDAHGVAGMRVLPFERDAQGEFTPPDRWDLRAAAMTSTHDLPPIAGWWRGRDIEWRGRLGAEGDRQAEQADRATERGRFWRSACLAGSATGEAPAPDAPDRAVDAAIGQVASSACELALIPLEDLLGLDEQPNIPGVVDGHPNWRRRAPVAADILFDEAATAARTDLLQKARPR